MTLRWGYHCSIPWSIFHWFLFCRHWPAMHMNVLCWQPPAWCSPFWCHHHQFQAMPMVNHLGCGNNAHGYFVTMSILGGCGNRTVPVHLQKMSKNVSPLCSRKFVLQLRFQPWKATLLGLYLRWISLWMWVRVLPGRRHWFTTSPITWQTKLVEAAIAGISRLCSYAIGTLSTPFFSKRMKKINDEDCQRGCSGWYGIHVARRQLNTVGLTLQAPLLWVWVWVYAPASIFDAGWPYRLWRVEIRC